MLSLFINSVQNKNDERFNIYVLIISIIYVILHYIIFNLAIIDKYKYAFYAIVLCDIIYFVIHYRKLNNIEPMKQLKPIQQPQLNKQYAIIEKPYLENNNIRQYVPLDDYYNIDVPRNRKVEEILNKDDYNKKLIEQNILQQQLQQERLINERNNINKQHLEEKEKEKEQKQEIKKDEEDENKNKVVLDDDDENKNNSILKDEDEDDETEEETDEDFDDDDDDEAEQVKKEPNIELSNL